MQYARGFDLKRTRGWYRQGKFWHPDADQGTATVLFDIDRAHDISMERFVEPVIVTDSKTGDKVSRRAHFHGKHRGLWWQPPGMTIDTDDSIWIVEGCMDAIALNLNGQKAVAILSCYNFPEFNLEKYQNNNVEWIWALDNDPAGRTYIQKGVTRCHELGFCCISGIANACWQGLE